MMTLAGRPGVASATSVHEPDASLRREEMACGIHNVTAVSRSAPFECGAGRPNAEFGLGRCHQCRVAVDFAANG